MSSSLKNKKDSIMTQSSMGAQSVEPTFIGMTMKLLVSIPARTDRRNSPGDAQDLICRPFRTIPVKFSTVAQWMISCLILKAVC